MKAIKTCEGFSARKVPPTLFARVTASFGVEGTERFRIWARTSIVQVWTGCLLWQPGESPGHLWW